MLTCVYSLDKPITYLCTLLDTVILHHSYFISLTVFNADIIYYKNT